MYLKITIVVLFVKYWRIGRKIWSAQIACRILVPLFGDLFDMKIVSEILSPLLILSREINFKKNATLEIISPRCGNEFYHAYYSDKHTLCFVNENIFQTRKSNFFKKEKNITKIFGMNSRLHRYSWEN